ncbi:conserved hypothetical protein [Agrobacterium fabacearum CFBP 5771]|uniref:hypothetical protein n=1 Tax=Agrobacterium tumefaciens TaxID=358 RepID=UPI0009BC2B80|nr:hypothetical protein [Agrobacterium tumefaciens]CVI17428.1 conserved hypothetical protein [Agrobacterium fabacearum CFBP 5771]
MSTPTTIPTHHVFVVDGEGANAFWTKIGAAWQHADGKGFNMILNAIPLEGRVVVRSVKAAEERTGKGRN